jgi:hypothetical protein
MRGIPSIFFNRQPDLSTFRRGIIVLSCSERYDERIASRACAWMPDVDWTVVKRLEPSFPWFGGTTLFSCYSLTMKSQLSFLRDARRNRYDVAVVAWTNEKSYRRLQWLCLFLGFKYLVVYNENVDAYVACRDTLPTLAGHLRWRFGQKRTLGGRSAVAEVASWLFLFPPAILYILARTSLLVLRKHLRRA